MLLSVICAAQSPDAVGGVGEPISKTELQRSEVSSGFTHSGVPRRG
jgi:hypothetical protein